MSSIVPVSSPVPSARDLALSVMVQKMSRNPEDEATGMALAAGFGAGVNDMISASAIAYTLKTVRAVGELLDLGYERDDDVVKDLFAFNREQKAIAQNYGRALQGFLQA